MNAAYRPAHRPGSDPDALSLSPYLLDIWERRWFMAVSLAIVAVLYGGWGMVAFLNTPSDLTAEVEFRLVFDGAQRQQYPNGTAFSRADLISTSVLSEVYRVNQLERYLPFEQFQDSVFVLESNLALELLGYEYQARLADVRLPAIERSRLEAEFRQKRDSQTVPQMFLRIQLPSRGPAIPTPVFEKVLNDILSVWAEQAKYKGSLMYQLDLLTPNIVRQDELPATDFIRADLLRRHVVQAVTQLAEVGRLPAAHTIRVGANQLSLADVRTDLSDMLEYHLGPAIRRGLASGAPPEDTQRNLEYLAGRVLELRTLRQAADDKRVQLQSALESFTTQLGRVDDGSGPAERGSGTVSAELSESFLDRLISMAGQSGGSEYRQQLTDRIIAAGDEALRVQQDMVFYQESLRLVQTAPRGVGPAAAERAAMANVSDIVRARLRETITLTGEAYNRISEANLNVRGRLYDIAGPYSVRTATNRSLRSVAVALVSVLLLTLILLSAIAVAQGVWRRHASPAGRSVSADAEGA